MKHLKLLVLLLAVLTTVFSYGQGRVSISVNEGQSMTTIAAHVDASNPFGSNFMTGSGFVVGMARGTDSIHASTPAGSSFGLFDPTDPNGPAITTVQGGDGTLTIDLPHEVTIAVDSMNNFYLGVIFMGFSGTYSETVTLSAGGTVVEVTFTAYNADDSTQTVTPTLSLTDVHTEMPCEMTGGLMMGSGYVIGMAQGIDTIHFQFPATSNFSLIDPNTAMGAPLANSVGEGGDGRMPNFLRIWTSIWLPAQVLRISTARLFIMARQVTSTRHCRLQHRGWKTLFRWPSTLIRCRKTLLRWVAILSCTRARHNWF